MNVQRFLHAVDRFSTMVGKAFSWLIVALMLTVCVEVFKRYALNAPTAWIYDANNMMYGTLFMMGGAYALARRACAGDFLYGSMKPRTQAALDLILFVLFFLPGVLALTWSGWVQANESLAIREQTFNAQPLPLYPFKFVIPVAGAILLLQGIAEMVRCVICLRTGEWTPRLKDAEEMDVVEQQLKGGTYIDEAAKAEAIERTKHLEETLHQRGGGGQS
jgi:TRAP-type mannitol/chloroaromatic compound transport system permease small subunit